MGLRLRMRKEARARESVGVTVMLPGVRVRRGLTLRSPLFLAGAMSTPAQGEH